MHAPENSILTFHVWLAVGTWPRHKEVVLTSHQYYNNSNDEHNVQYQRNSNNNNASNDNVNALSAHPEVGKCKISLVFPKRLRQGLSMRHAW